MQRISLVLCLLAAAAAVAAATADPAAAAPDGPALVLDFGPLVEFGAAQNRTTIDPNTRSLFEAFAAAEQQLRATASGGPANDGATAGAHPKLSGLLAALQRTREKLNEELSDALGEKIFDRASALRERLGPKGMLRLIEEAQQKRGAKCKPGAFTPPKMAAAKITGPGAFLSVAAPLCTLQRKAAPLQVTLPIACTGAGVLLRETPAIYSAATLAPAKATTRECKAERKWGPEGTGEVILFDPKHLARQFGLLPADKFNNTGVKGLGADASFDDQKRAWSDGAADVKEAVKGLWKAMLGNVTVKDTPNGASAWLEKMAAQAEAVGEKFEALRSKMAGAPHVVGKSDDGGGNGTAAAPSAQASARRREAEQRLRALAAEYLEERLAAMGGPEGGDEDGNATTTGARLAAALRDLAVGAVEEVAPPGLFAEVKR